MMHEPLTRSRFALAPSPTRGEGFFPSPLVGEGVRLSLKGEAGRMRGKSPLEGMHGND